MAEHVVSSLEATFQKADAELASLENKVKRSQLQLTDDKDSDSVKLSAPELASRLRNIRTEYASIIQEVKEMQIKQQEALQFMGKELVSAINNMQILQQSTQENVNVPEEVAALEKLTGIKMNNIEG